LSTKKVPPGEARARMTRGAVLTVGGLTLLAGYLLDPARQVTDTAGARDARGATAAGQVPDVSASRGAATHPALAEPRAAGGQPMYHVDDGPKAIALTVDDGPSPVYTPQVLRLLEKYRRRQPVRDRSCPEDRPPRLLAAGCRFRTP
jgi:hypothetical protein